MRTRIVGKAVVREGGTGTIRWAIEAHGAALTLLRASDRNELVREALIDGGKFYVSVFVPMNFTEYAKRKGYHVSEAFSNRKTRLIQRGVIDGPNLPLVYAGVLREAAVNRSTVTSTATSNNATIRIHIPIPPHGNARKGTFGIAKIVGAVLRTIMPWEVERVAEVVETSMIRGLQGRMEQRFQAQAAPPARQMVQGNRRNGPLRGPNRERIERARAFTAAHRIGA